MVKTRTYFGLFLLILLLSCQREQLHQAGVGVGFAVSERIPDFETKAPAAWSTQAGEYSLLATQEWIPVRPADTKVVKLYGSADSTPLQGDPIAVWAYNMAAANASPSQWLLDGGSASGAVQASYDSSSEEWVASTVSYNSSKRASSYYTRWFAVAPWDAVGSGATPTGLANGQTPGLSYQVPASAASQHDLMVASTSARGINDNSAVPLAFHHVLSAIRIKAEKDINVTQAIISGVYDQANLNLLDGTWEDLAISSSSASFTASLSDASAWDRTDTQYDYTKDAGILMMLPQWLPEGATIKLVVDGTEVTADLSGHQWLMGKLVTYRIKGSGAPRDYYIEAEVTGELPSSGSAAKVATVNSYFTPEGGGDPSPASWVVKGIYSTQALAQAGGTPDLSGWNATVDGSGLKVSSSSATAVNKTVNQLLQEAPAWGSADQPWNLSNRINGGADIHESANTYIINAPGYYRIPLVAGNGIIGGSANSSAYPSNFVDYKGNSISNPYLHKTSSSAGVPASAAVVWTENSNMVQSLSVSKDEENDLYWLGFQIQNAQQGCTVVSVKDASGTVMWSWLLWVTDYEPGMGDVGGANASFMSRNLGWTVDGTMTGAKPAAVAFVRIEAENDASAYAVVRVRRAAGVPSGVPYTGHGPYFQWGRKDAMPPTAAGWSSATTGNKKKEDLIKNPGLHFPNTLYPYVADGGFTEFNYWSASATDAAEDLATVKTVYDPCPAGYTVPRQNAFDGLSGSWISGSGYAGYSLSSGALYLPAAGYRNQAPSNGNVAGTTTGRYWVAVAQPGTGNAARRLEVSSSGLNLPSGGGNNQKPMEFSIRPAREE